MTDEAKLTQEEETSLLLWREQQERTAIQEEANRIDSPPPAQPRVEHLFDFSEDRAKLVVPEISASFEVDFLRRERGELIGELTVRCSLPGVRTFKGVVSTSNFNLSSARTRSDRAKLLSSRTDGSAEVIEGIDWHGYIEELCQRVLTAERTGQPAVDLRTVPAREHDDAHCIDGFVLPRRHPSILFGDGGACKSFIALYVLIKLAERGFRVSFFDWELCQEEYRQRLERIAGPDMPIIFYVKCIRPLVYEADRLTRLVRENRIDYAVYDSVVFATSGPAETSEAANSYFQAVRKVGIGSLHIAHVSKGENNDQRPFGSIFYHNAARSTYFAKAADASPDGRETTVGLYNRKANLSRLHPPTGFTIRFEDARTIFTRSNPADDPDLATKLSIRERLYHVLRDGDQNIDDLAEEFDVQAQSIRNTATRSKNLFVIRGGKIGLAYR